MVGCSEHRTSLMLLAMKRKLAQGDMDRGERQRLEEEIEKLEKELDMD